MSIIRYIHRTTMASFLSSKPSPAPQEPCSAYVSMPDPETTTPSSNNNNNNNNTTPQTPAPERHIFWELVHFARHRSWKKKVLTAVICLTSAYVLLDLIFLGNVMRGINAFLEWMIRNPTGAVFSFIFFFTASTLCFVPPAILMFGAGYAFAEALGFAPGVLMATLVSFIGSCLGAWLAFLRSRYMMRDLMELFAARYPIIKATDAAMKRNGFHVMLLLRLCPIIPFNGLNYIGGVTAISMGDYNKALIGILPVTLLWVFIGASADALANRDADGNGEQLYALILISSGIAFGILAAILIVRLAMDELQKEIAANSAESWLRYRRPQDALAVDTGSNVAKNNAAITTSTPPVSAATEEGVEVTSSRVLDLQAPGILAALGIVGKSGGVEASHIPPDGQDEEWFWIWS